MSVILSSFVPGARLGALILLTVAVGAGPPLRAEGEPAPGGSATVAACPAIDGIEQVIGKGKVVLLGEIHGTAEAPAFTGDVDCHALRAGLAVTVALELPRAEQEAIDVMKEVNDLLRRG